LHAVTAIVTIKYMNLIKTVSCVASVTFPLHLHDKIVNLVLICDNITLNLYNMLESVLWYRQ